MRRVVIKKQEISLDLQQEYKALKVLHSLTGKEFKLEDFWRIIVHMFKTNIEITIKDVSGTFKILNDTLIDKFGMYPMIFMDCMYYNGATCQIEGKDYLPSGVPAKKNTGWIQDSKGFWKKVH